MPDYKELYLKLFRASEDAINILIEAQRVCEAMYLEQYELEEAKEESVTIND